MDLREFMIEPERLWTGEESLDQPLAIIELGQDAAWHDDLALPACPVIGIGSRDAPMAAFADTVVEPPVPLDLLASQILDKPRAAASVVQLLRILPALSLTDGLIAESFAYAMLQGSAEHRAWRDARPASAGAAAAAGRVELTRDGAVLSVVLDRQEAGNAIDRAMRDGLYQALQMAALDPGIARVCVGARGKTFSLGADLDEFGTTLDPAMAHEIRGLTLPARMAARCADKLEFHIAGACVGAGLEIAAYARRITAAPNAWFQLPELAMGVLPGAGGCVSLTRRIGRQRAALLILSGKRLSAGRAHEWGLIDAIVDDAASDNGERDRA